MNILSGELHAMTRCRLILTKNMTQNHRHANDCFFFHLRALFVPAKTRTWLEWSRLQFVKSSGCSLPSESVENRHDNTHMHEKLQRPLHTEPTRTQVVGMLLLVALVPLGLFLKPFRESTSGPETLSRYLSLLRLPLTRCSQSPQGS